MRFSFFAVLATAVSAASLNAMIEDNFDYDLYEADDLDFAETWSLKDEADTTKDLTKSTTAAADQEAREVKQGQDLMEEAKELENLAKKMLNSSKKSAGVQ